MDYKKEAKRIYERVLQWMPNIRNFDRIGRTKKCALICVDEKIKTIQYVCELKNGMSTEELQHISDLLKVKTEIENL